MLKKPAICLIFKVLNQPGQPLLITQYVNDPLVVIFLKSLNLWLIIYFWWDTSDEDYVCSEF